MFIYISNDICSLQKILIFTIQAKFHLIPFLFKGIKDGIYFINNNSK